MFNFSIVLLAAQLHVNHKIKSDIDFSGHLWSSYLACSLTTRETKDASVSMMARHQVFVFVSFFFLSSVIKFDKKCANSTQRSPSSNSCMKLTIVSAKSKTHSPRQGYISLGNFIILEIDAALLFTSVTNSCRFWGSFVESQALFQKTCLFSWFMHTLRAYCHHGLKAWPNPRNIST